MIVPVPVPEVLEGACLVKGDCRKATDLAPGYREKVSLAVTSPPYHNAISYDTHVADPTANYRDRPHLSYADDYLPFLDAAWDACWELLKPGGHLAINVGTVLLDGYQFPLPQDILSRLDASGLWAYVGTILWNKVTAGVKRAGTVIQRRMPGYWHPNIMTEHILVVRKPGEARDPDRGVPTEWFLPVWDLAPVPPNTVSHPAPFPEDLPHRLIRMLTHPGEIVLDPFNGAGTTTKAASDLGRRSIGFDVEDAYLRYAEDRLAAGSQVRARQLVVKPTLTEGFSPPPSRGRTRHGAGLAARTRL